MPRLRHIAAFVAVFGVGIIGLLVYLVAVDTIDAVTAALVANTLVIGVGLLLVIEGIRRTHGNTRRIFRRHDQRLQSLRDDLNSVLDGSIRAVEQSRVLVEDVRGAIGENRVELLARLEKANRQSLQLSSRIGEVREQLTHLQQSLDPPSSLARSGNGHPE